MNFNEITCIFFTLNFNLIKKILKIKYKMTQVDKNSIPNQNNQLQPTNDLSRFGHSVTLCKGKIFKFKI